MSASQPGRLVSVKLTPVGRAQTFLAADPPIDPPPIPGHQVVVHAENGQAVGTVVRANSALADKRRPPADSPQRVVRLATRDDLVARHRSTNRAQTFLMAGPLSLRKSAMVL